MAQKYKQLHFVTLQSLVNWSVAHLINRDLGFTKKFPFARIGDVITRSTLLIHVEDDVLYKQVTVKTNGGGAVLRDEKNGKKKGKDIGIKKQYIAKEGQFIMSKIDARNGAFGIISKELDGAIVTGDFPLFDVNTELLNPFYLYLLSTTKPFIQYAQSCSRGTTNRQRIDVDAFLSQEIPLPSLNEQQILVDEYKGAINYSYTRFSEGLIKAREAQTYLSNSIGAQERFPNGACGEFTTFEIVSYKKIQEWGSDKILCSRVYQSSKYDTETLGNGDSLYHSIMRGKSPIYDKNSNLYVLNQKCIRWNDIAVQYAKTVNEKWLHSVDKKHFTQEGDVLINSTGEGTIGRATVVTKAHEGLLYDSHILLLRLNKEKLDPRYFTLVFNSRYGQEQVNNVKSAKTTKQTELGIENLKKIQIPIPPLGAQQEIVAKLYAMHEEIADLQNTTLYEEQALEDFRIKIFE